MNIKNTTTLKDLLDNHPHLETTLSRWLPALQDLKQEALKETALAAANLEHLARVTGRQVGELIEEARSAAGQNGEPSFSMDQPRIHSDDPDWVRGPVAHRVDGTALLTRGLHPLSEVKSRLAQMAPGELLLLTANFHPQPMIKAMEAQGLAVHSRQDLEDPGRHVTFIKK